MHVFTLLPQNVIPIHLVHRTKLPINRQLTQKRKRCNNFFTKKSNFNVIRVFPIV